MDVCLTEIDRAQPLFLGLVGNRYGTIPDAAHVRWVAAQSGVPDDERLDGLSVTAVEFSRGFLWDSARIGDPTVFIRSIAGTVPEGWSDPDGSAVLRFRQQIEEASRRNKAIRTAAYVVQADGAAVDLRVVHDVTTPQDSLGADGVTAQPGSEATSTFEEFAVRYLLPRVIDRATSLGSMRSPGVSAADDLFREDHAISVGREPTINDVSDALLDEGRGRVTILGESGVGKSTVLVAVEKRVRDAGAVVLSCLVGSTYDIRTPVDVVRVLSRGVSEYLGRDISTPNGNYEELMAQWWSELIVDLSESLKNRLIIVVDAFDHIAQPARAGRLWPITCLPRDVAVLVTTTRPEDADALAVHGCAPVEIGPLSGENAKEAASAWASFSGFVDAEGRPGRTKRSLPRSTVEALGLEEHIPLWIRLAVDWVTALDADDFSSMGDLSNKSTIITELLLRRARCLPDSVTELAQRFLDWSTARVGPQSSRLVGLLALARSGLTVSDLAGLAADVQDGHWIAAQTRRALGGQVRGRGSNGRLTFTHQILKTAATRLAPGDGHNVLAEYFVRRGVVDSDDAMDVVWHVMHSSLPNDVPAVALALEQALNLADARMEALVREAMLSVGSRGVDWLNSMPGGSLTDAGMRALLESVSDVDVDALARTVRLPWLEAVLALAMRQANGEASTSVAWAQESMAKYYWASGDLQMALSTAVQSVDTAREVAAMNSVGDLGIESTRQLASCLCMLSEITWSLGDMSTAESCSREALDLRLEHEDRLEDNDNNISGVLGQLAYFANERGDVNEAMKYWRLALEHAERTALAHPQYWEHQHNLVASLVDLGGCHESVGELDEAQRRYEEALLRARALWAERPRSPASAELVAHILTWLAAVWLGMGRVSDAQASCEEAVSIRRGIHEASPDSPGPLERYGMALGSLGDTLVESDKTRARACFIEALEIARVFKRMSPDAQEANHSLIAWLSRLGDLEVNEGNSDVAWPYYEEALAISQAQAEGSAQDRVSPLTDLAALLNNTGECALALGRADQAATLMAESVVLWRELRDLQPGVVSVISNLGVALDNLTRLLATSDPDGAADAAREAAACREQVKTMVSLG
jgi:tetratricopeptide (TPR) repeat protein